MNASYRCLLLCAVACLALAGCGPEEAASPPDQAMPAAAPPMPRSVDAAQKPPVNAEPVEAVSEPAALLPETAPVEGWTRTDDVAVYDASNIFDHIDGEAEIYFPYGFRTAAVTRYAGAGEGAPSVSVDIYEMGSLLDGFGIYSNYRSAGREPAGFGADGQYTDYQLIFYQGPYFVRVSASGDPEQTRSAMLAFGGAVAEAIDAPAGPPEELALMAVEGIDPETVQYIAESLMGYKFFPRGFMGYMKDLAPAAAFVVMADSENAAVEVLDQYTHYVVENNGSHAEEDGYIVANDPLYKTLVIAQRGPYLLGAAKVPDAAAGKAIVDALAANVQ